MWHSFASMSVVFTNIMEMHNTMENRVINDMNEKRPYMIFCFESHSLILH